jgi:hypothetical protein
MICEDNGYFEKALLFVQNEKAGYLKGYPASAC